LEETCRKEHLEAVITVAESWPEAKYQILHDFRLEIFLFAFK
jgi:hypothetical protein